VDDADTLQEIEVSRSESATVGCRRNRVSYKFGRGQLAGTRGQARPVRRPRPRGAHSRSRDSGGPWPRSAPRPDRCRTRLIVEAERAGLGDKLAQPPRGPGDCTTRPGSNHMPYSVPDSCPPPAEGNSLRLDRGLRRVHGAQRLTHRPPAFGPTTTPAGRHGGRGCRTADGAGRR